MTGAGQSESGKYLLRAIPAKAESAQEKDVASGSLSQTGVAGTNYQSQT